MRVESEGSSLGTRVLNAELSRVRVLVQLQGQEFVG